MSTGTGTGGAVARVAGGSPESGLGGELAAAGHDHANGHDHDPDNDHDNDHESDFDYYYCEPDLQPVGYCKALYAFEGNFTILTFNHWNYIHVHHIFIVVG